jgi:soluble lytic murein transglycosylase
MSRRAALLCALAVAVVLSHAVGGQERVSPGGGRTGVVAAISPTDHPPVPDAVSDYWLVPDASPRRNAAVEGFVRGVALVEAGRFADGLPLVRSPELAATAFRNHAEYYAGVALIGLQRYADADAVLAGVVGRDPQGHLAEALPQRVAEAALGLNDPGRAVDVLEDLLDDKPLARDAVLLQLAQAAEQDGDIDRALAAYREIYYELPMSPKGVDAQAAFTRLETADRIPPDRFQLELERAQTLFDARRWAQARAGFEPLARVARGDAAEIVSLRLAECDYYLDRFRAARDRLAPLLAGVKREAEARFFHLTATRALGDHATYVRLARRLVADHADSSWAEETLQNLATHYITIDDDEQADRVFRELLQRFPRSRHSERAAWKVGWRAYRAGNVREAAETFERAAAAFPRADYRPAWLYWSGRSRARLKQPELAAERFAVAVADYGNSYYGRLATRAMEGRTDVQRVANVRVRPRTSSDGEIPTAALIRDLIGGQLYDLALREVQYAQQQWGDSPRLQATSAYIRHNQGRELKAQERFNALRGAINTMRRAYPQFMAAGGEQMPPDVLRIIFPLDYWPLITKYSKAHDLDPFLMAALMAQESTFTAEIRSSANAIGLMQLIPGTGRRVARQLGIRNFATSHLTRPETNVRLGMRYFKDLMVRFGGAHYALAGYNAGEARVDRWIAERPPLPADEFVDDIPFPETQNYVKRILGTAEDYRFLYGSGLLDPNAPLAVASADAAPRAPGSAGASPRVETVSTLQRSTLRRTSR